MSSFYSPSPPAPRKMPPTASASHSLDTPMIMQPATMLSRAEPTRSPWYSPTLTAFIQYVQAPTLGLQTCSALRLCPSLTAALTCHWRLNCHVKEPPCLLFFHSLQHRNTFSDVSCIFKDEAQVSIAN